MADVDFVTSLYQNVLARDPDPDGLKAWVNYIERGGTHDEVRSAFINCAETQNLVNPIVRLYEGILNRAPDVQGLEAWVGALGGGASLGSITEAFLKSSEALNNGLTDDLSNEAFIAKLYQSIGRAPDQITPDPGFAHWVTALESMSHAEVAQAFMECAENLQNSNAFVTSWGTLRATVSASPTTARFEIFSDSAKSVDPQSVLMSGSAVDDDINLTGAGVVTGGGGHDSIFGLSQGTGAISAITGSGNDSISVFAGKGLIAAGDGDDTLVLRGEGSLPGSGFVDAGGGNDTISVGGAVTVNAGAGNDSINVFQSANASIDVGAGSDTVFVAAGDATVTNQIGGSTNLQLHLNTGNVRFVGSGNDTITLGSGNDTIIEAGSATVQGGTGHSTIQAGSGEFRFTGVSGIDSVTAGSGSATMIAGAGNTVFTAGSGSASVSGRGGNVTMVGGSGHETMVAGSKASLFSFDSAHGGGTTIISGFQDSTVPGVKSTQLEFKGYGSPSDILAHSQAEGDNTIISLDDGTTIFLKDFNLGKFGSDDIKS